MKKQFKVKQIRKMTHNVKVESVAINEMQYDNQTNEAVLTFASGNAYKYFGVTQSEWDKFMKAESKGSYFHKFKSKHPKFEKVKNG